MDEWMIEWMNEWLDEWVDGWVDEWMDVCGWWESQKVGLIRGFCCGFHEPMNGRLTHQTVYQSWSFSVIMNSVLPLEDGPIQDSLPMSPSESNPHSMRSKRNVEGNLFLYLTKASSLHEESWIEQRERQLSKKEEAFSSFLLWSQP